MTAYQNLPEFKRDAVEPVECLKRGWDLIKDQYWLFVGMAFLSILIGGAVPFGILMGPMMCGLYLTFFRRIRGETVEFGTLFKGFDYFGDSIIASLLHYVPLVLIILPFYFFLFLGPLLMAPSHGDGPNSAAVVGFLSVFLIGILVMLILIMILTIGFAFAYPLIVDRRLSGMDAVKVSFKAGFGNFWRLFGLFLLNGVLGFVGVLLCYVGLFFVLPITFAGLAVAYGQVFGSMPQQPPGPPPPPSFT